MNETLKTLLSRRSIRNYRPDQIKEEELTAILEAARFAPSGRNSQPWHFSVVQKGELLRKINEGCREAYLNSGIQYMEERARTENFSIFYHAPALVVVSGDPKALTTQIDCAMAVQNIFLSAESLNIGSCWINGVITLVNSEKGGPFRQDLGIPDGYEVMGAAALGYKGGAQPAPQPRKEGTVTVIR